MLLLWHRFLNLWCEHMLWYYIMVSYMYAVLRANERACMNRKAIFFSLQAGVVCADVHA